MSCVAEEGELALFRLSINGTWRLMNLPRVVSAVGIDGGVSYLFGPITRSDDGLVFECNNGQPLTANLQVRCKFPVNNTAVKYL